MKIKMICVTMVLFAVLALLLLRFYPGALSGFLVGGGDNSISGPEQEKDDNESAGNLDEKNDNATKGTEPGQENGENDDEPQTGGAFVSGSGDSSGGYGTGETCTKDSDCGTERYEEPYCSGKSIYRNLVKHLCVNQGLPDAHCSESQTMEIKEECVNMCYNGKCVQETAVVFLDPANMQANAGSEVNADVMFSTLNPAYAVQFELIFDLSVLEVVQVSEGDILKQEGASTYPVISFSNEEGRVVFASTRVGTKKGVTGGGTLSRITFRGKTNGYTNLEFQNVIVSDPAIEEIPSTSIDGAIHISS